MPSFKSMKSSSLARKNLMGIISLPSSVSGYDPTLCKRVSVQNTSVGIGLIELTESSDTLNYKPFFKECILKTILHVFFIVYICVKQNLLFYKLSCIVYIFLIWFGLAFGVIVVMVLLF